jgi:hypothetical protein
MTPRAHGVAVFLNLCGSAGAQENAPVCRIWREGFSLSSGRMSREVLGNAVVIDK